MLNAVIKFGQTGGFTVPVVQELAAKSLETLPERYIRSEQERPSLQNHDRHKNSSIPTIDMASFLDDDNSKQNEMKKLALACQEWGFFQVVNHGIPESLMKRMKGVVREFFQLPLDEKLKYASQGLDGYGQAFVASDDQKLDWADLMLLYTHPLHERRMDFWPTKPADFRETLDQYSADLQRVGCTLLRLLAQSLELQIDELVPKFEHIVQSMRINYYPPCPEPDLALGLSAHSDGSCITMLLQDDEILGLQIRKDEEWLPVPPILNALVINIGDIPFHLKSCIASAHIDNGKTLSEVTSNGRYKSIEHRAITSKGKDRISIATFIKPPREAMVRPAPKLIDELHPCGYKQFTAEDYMRNYFKCKLDGKNAIQYAKMNASE